MDRYGERTKHAKAKIDSKIATWVVDRFGDRLREEDQSTVIDNGSMLKGLKKGSAACRWMERVDRVNEKTDTTTTRKFRLCVAEDSLSVVSE